MTTAEVVFLFWAGSLMLLFFLGLIFGEEKKNE